MKIAFVIPWYGDIPGGAEDACKRTAENLKKNGVDVEVLTTCAKEFLSDWNNNFYTEGVYDVNGITVRRFKLKPRDAGRFDTINYKLMHNKKVSSQEELQFINEMINSDNLCKYLADNESKYDYFIFIPYMFGTTYFGCNSCSEKSILIPCLHDEGYAYMNIYQEMFRGVKGLIFLSKPEQNLATKIYDVSNKKQVVVGVGIDANIKFNQERFKEKYGVEDKFILYAGRREPGKNVPLLIDYFAEYKQNCDNDLKLVLIGSGDVKIPLKYKKEIIDLGFIPKQDKYDAYSAATVLCQPSVNESFSIVIMESWLCGRPVLVHSDCEVTKDHCIKCNGGLYFRDYEEFQECIDFCLHNPEIARKMGLMGKEFVLNNYGWEVIINKYKNIFKDWSE
jgi:glycosyltransferase involved in cell wall biosynthesis